MNKTGIDNKLKKSFNKQIKENKGKHSNKGKH